jgi:SpoVK/Ycf46/Vps4 family AAA+-type ATPase
MKHLVHELPDENELLSILNDICPTVSTDDADDDMSHDTRKLIAKHSLGLTRTQAEGIYASCHVLHGKIDPAYVWKEKSLILNREGLVSLYTGKETFKDVAGLEGMKDFITRLLTPDRFNKDDESVRAKGILACGFPGVGKSLVAKAVGNELNLPVLMVNPSAWFGSYVGESEAKTRKGFQIIKAHAPCVAIIDEVEKVMPSSRGGKGDSGVGARMEGTFLTAMNDMTERVFWMFTANDVTNMHEAFFRAERVDATFYVKLPGPKQRAELWKLYGKKYYPPEVSVDGVMEPFPRYVSTDLKLALEKLKAATLKKPADIVQWGEKLVLPLLCLGSEEAVKAAMESIRKISAEVADAIEKFSDDGWSPAEIQACCRLSRVVGESLTATSKRIRPLSLSSPKILDKLEEWAECSALDAETGRLFTRESLDGGPDGTDVGMDNASPVKRKRKLRKA